MAVLFSADANANFGWLAGWPDGWVAARLGQTIVGRARAPGRPRSPPPPAAGGQKVPLHRHRHSRSPASFPTSDVGHASPRRAQESSWLCLSPLQGPAYLPTSAVACSPGERCCWLSGCLPCLFSCIHFELEVGASTPTLWMPPLLPTARVGREKGHGHTLGEADETKHHPACTAHSHSGCWRLPTAGPSSFGCAQYLLFRQTSSPPLSRGDWLEDWRLAGWPCAHCNFSAQTERSLACVDALSWTVGKRNRGAACEVARQRRQNVLRPHSCGVHSPLDGAGDGSLARRPIGAKGMCGDGSMMNRTFCCDIVYGEGEHARI